MTKSTAGTKKKELLILEDRCKSCAFCIEFCPKQCLSLAKEANVRGYHPVQLNEKGSDCTMCNLCGLVCPEFAITTIEIDDLQENK